MEADYVDEDYENRMISFEIDCHGGKGSPEACHHVGDFISIVKNDKARAAKIYQQNCDENKHLPSCFNVARIYAAGKGVQKDIPRAESLFQRSCEGGVLHACYFYGVMLGAPEKTPEEKAKGLQVLVDACRKNEVESCYTAGNYYLIPKNPQRNPPLAEEFLKRACHESYAPACHNLAVIYRNGDTNVPANQKLFEDYRKRTQSLFGQREELQKLFKKAGSEQQVDSRSHSEAK